MKSKEETKAQTKGQISNKDNNMTNKILNNNNIDKTITNKEIIKIKIETIKTEEITTIRDKISRLTSKMGIEEDLITTDQKDNNKIDNNKGVFTTINSNNPNQLKEEYLNNHKSQATFNKVKVQVFNNPSFHRA